MSGNGDLLSGGYDCVDRVVLNAYSSLGHNPGGFRTVPDLVSAGCMATMSSWTARI